MACCGVSYSTLLVPLFIVIWVQYFLETRRKLQAGGSFDLQDTFVLGALGLYILVKVYFLAQQCGIGGTCPS